MDLSVPCSVEGRSELRNVSRVNCKTHWLSFELWNTLLTERIYRIADFYIALAMSAARLVESAFYFLQM